MQDNSLGLRVSVPLTDRIYHLKNNLNNVPSVSYSPFALCVVFLGLYLQLPAGPAHIFLGKLAYIKDLVLIMALVPAFLVVLKDRESAAVSRGLFSILALIAAGFALLLLSGWHFLSGLLMSKWVLLWFVAYAFGIMFRQSRVGHKRIIILLLMGYLLTEVYIGLWEIRTQNFFFESNLQSVELTAAGLEVARTNTLGEYIRVRGLQRSVFQYSNCMAIGAVFSCYFVICGRRLLLKLLMLCLLCVCSYCTYKSGGRTGLVGLSFGLLALAPLFIRHKQVAWCRVFAVCAFVAGLLISMAGPSTLVGWLVGGNNANSEIMQLDSTFMREANWSEIWDGMTQNAEVFFAGSLLIGIATEQVDPIRIVDNQYLWLAYHYGFLLGPVLIYAGFWSFWRVLERVGASSVATLATAVLCLNFGEGIGRESAFLYSALVFLSICGFGACSHTTKVQVASGGRGK